MKRFNIICEGPTEVKIIRDIIHPHLDNISKCVCVPFDLGGNPKFDRIVHYLTKWIKKEPDAIFTTMIDYYGLKANFPGYSINPSIHYLEKAKTIETAFAEVVKKQLPFQHHLIPYFQMHEFEALLFSDINILWDWLKLYNSRLKIGEVEAVLKGFESPEEINQKKETSPSHRIINLVGENRYHKVTDGKLILEQITLELVREKCPHFNSWLALLEGKLI